MTESVMMRLLVVDDEEDMVDILRYGLGMRGVGVVGAGGPAAAFDLLRRGRFDAILSDYDMPEMNGLELFREIRAAGITTPFLLWSAAPRDVPAGVAFIRKTPRLDELVRALRALLDVPVGGVSR